MEHARIPMKPLLTHYDALDAYNKNKKQDIIGIESLKTKEIKHFDTWKKIRTNTKVEDQNYNAYILEKNNTKYLLEAIDTTGNTAPNSKDYRINIEETLPIKIEQTVPIAHKNTVYDRIINVTPVKILPEQEFTFRQLIQELSQIQHTHPTQQTLYWIIAIASYYDKVYTRVSTQPSFGKDSTIETLKLLIGHCRAISSTEITTAKIEYELRNQILSLNELAGIQNTDWERVEEVIKDASSGKPTLTKRSRSYEGVGEEIDVSHNSIQLLYNNKHNYTENREYIDNRAGDALLDRFLPLQLKGTINDNRIAKKNTDDYKKLAEEKKKYYDNLCKTLKYYEINPPEPNIDKHYEPRKELSDRQNTSRSVIIKYITAYAEDTEEADKLVKTLDESTKEYHRMLTYTELERATLNNIENKERKQEIQQALQRLDSYKDKNVFLQSLERGGNGKLI